MKKDPKRVLESLRVEEEDPLLHHRPRKFRKRKNELSQVQSTAILSLCLVTGLSTGMGSAFANTLDEQAKGHLPLDEPPSKVQLDSNIEQPQLQVPQVKSSEVTPNKPPLDEPATNVINQQPKHNDTVHKDIKKSTSKQENHPKKAETDPNSTKSIQSPVKQKEVTKSIQSPVKQKEVTKSPSTHTETKKQEDNTKEQVEKTVVPFQKSKTVDTKREEKQHKEQHITISNKEAVHQPKTVEGGELPQTAGDDLNNAALGAGAALVGALLLKRKRVKTE